MKKKIFLNKTQFFLRFLKKNNIYNAYISQLNKKGQNRWGAALDKNPTNPCEEFEDLNINENFWEQMMDWPNKKSTYFVNGYSGIFWHDIDQKWVNLWGNFMDKNPQIILITRDIIHDLI